MLAALLLNARKGGHWKHAFTPAYGVTAPAVTSRRSASWRVVTPDVARISISSTTPCVVETRTARGAVLLPCLGTRTSSVSRRAAIHGSIHNPRCGATARFVRGGKAYATHGNTRPYCGAQTVQSCGKSWSTYSLLPPKAIQNLDPEVIVSLFS